MAMGLGEAASAVQIISLAFRTFQGCIDAYKFCHNAQRIGTDGDFLRTKLQIERIRLEDWATRSGLHSLPSSNKRLNWHVAASILKQQNVLLTSSERLKEKYQLDVPEETYADGDETKTGDGAPLAAPTGLERFLSALRPDMYTPGARAIDAANNTLRRLRWAAIGKDKLSKIIDDLSKLNDELERLLDAADREWLHSSVAAVLRGILSRSRNLDEVLEVQKLLHPSSSKDQQTIEAAADFKRVRLVLGVDKREDEVQPQPSAKTAAKMPVLTMLKERKLSLDTSASSQRVKLATYNGAAVVVEWRTTDADKFDALGVHMQCLALLLGTADPSFASLRCIGLLALKAQGQFGLVYEMPRAVDVEADKPSAHRSLHDLIALQGKISLKHRLSIACTIADAVLQLHTAGWLHKSIPSENVIFVSSEQGDAEAFLSTRPFLIGYDHARPNAMSSLTEQSDEPLLTNLYRHPNKRGVAGSAYRKSFNLYALACLLTELAMWEHIVDTFSRSAKQDWSAKIKKADSAKKDIKLPSLISIAKTSAFAHDIAHNDGPTYLEAIRLSLRGDSGTMEDAEVSLEPQRMVAEKLRECKV